MHRHLPLAGRTPKLIPEIDRVTTSIRVSSLSGLHDTGPHYNGIMLLSASSTSCPDYSTTELILMDLLPDTQHWGLCMRRVCRECFPRHRLQRKPLISDPGMHHGTCVTYVPWCMAGSLTRGGGENVPVIPGACATRNFTHLARGPWCGKDHIAYHLQTRRVTPFTQNLIGETSSIIRWADV